MLTYFDSEGDQNRSVNDGIIYFLSLFSKIIEKYALDQINKFSNKCSTLYKFYHV